MTGEWHRLALVSAGAWTAWRTGATGDRRTIRRGTPGRAVGGVAHAWKASIGLLPVGCQRGPRASAQPALRAGAGTGDTACRHASACQAGICAGGVAKRPRAHAVTVEADIWARRHRLHESCVAGCRSGCLPCYPDLTCPLGQPADSLALPYRLCEPIRRPAGLAAHAGLGAPAVCHVPRPLCPARNRAPPEPHRASETVTILTPPDVRPPTGRKIPYRPSLVLTSR